MFGWNILGSYTKAIPHLGITCVHFAVVFFQFEIGWPLVNAPFSCKFTTDNIFWSSFSVSLYLLFWIVFDVFRKCSRIIPGIFLSLISYFKAYNFVLKIGVIVSQTHHFALILNFTCHFITWPSNQQFCAELIPIDSSLLLKGRKLILPCYSPTASSLHAHFPCGNCSLFCSVSSVHETVSQTSPNH